MWTCNNCSYAYNRMWTERCEICENLRTQPSLTQPNLITVTKMDTMTTGMNYVKIYLRISLFLTSLEYTKNYYSRIIIVL